MAITNYLVHFKTEDTYNDKKSELRDDAVAFVKDATIIHTHGTDYYCGSEPVALKSDLSEYATTAALTSGLAGKANVSHTHTISQVSELQEELDLKQDITDNTLETTSKTVVGAINEILPKATGVGKVDPNSDGTGEIFNAYEGYPNIATGDHSHAEGYITTASGDESHAEGYNTEATGSSSHAEGTNTQATGTNAHAEGNGTTASGKFSHAEGYYTKATSTYSHAEGYYTQTFSEGEHAEGKYNKSYGTPSLSIRVIHSVGIGSDNNNRKNAHEIKLNGDHYIYGLGGFDGTNSAAAQTLQEVINSKQNTITAGTGLEFEGNTLNVTLDATVFKVVSALPDSPAQGDENKIHLVPAESTGENNAYTEYVWVNSAWEILGEYTSEVDLTPYLKTVDAQSTYATKTELTSGLAGKANTTHTHTISQISGLQTELDSKLESVSLADLGITATAAELNKLDGVIVTTQELNYVDGVTSNIQTQLNGKAASSHNHSAANITSGTLDLARIPSITDAKITSVSASKITGTIPQANLPSYVDDVLEYSSKSLFPRTGESGKIYVDTTTNLTYRWGGSSYVEISPSLALGETSSTAFRGDRGKIAYDHSQATGNPHNLTLSNLGISATATELNFVDGVTSNIQTQLNAKANTSTLASYALKNGSNTSGTWPISISGNASSATKLATARSIWGQTFDGTQGVDGHLYLGSKTYRLYFGTSGLTSFITGEDSGYLSINSANNTSAVATLLRINLSNGVISGNSISLSNNLAVSGAEGRGITYTGNDIILKAATGGWAMGIEPYHNDDTTSFSHSVGGAYGGDANTINYTYYGGTYNSPAMVILPNKMVGIGTTSPSYKLHVEGTGRFTGLLTAPGGLFGLTKAQADKYAENSNYYNLAVGQKSSSMGASLLMYRDSAEYQSYIVWSTETQDHIRIGLAADSNDLFIKNHKAGIQLEGTGNLTYNGYPLLHSANYTSYTVTKTGGGASGTWNINISGTAASANSVAWNNVSGKPSTFTPSTHTHSQYLTSASLNGYATQSWVNSQGFLRSATDTKNTTGTSNSTSKLYLAGGTSQSSTGVVTYSNSSVYTQSGQLYASSMYATNGFFETSDARLKTFGEDIKALDVVSEIPTKYFTWKSDESKTEHIGTSAQEIQKLYPDLVTENEDGVLSVDYARLSIIALAAIKELKAQIDELKSKN